VIYFDESKYRLDVGRLVRRGVRGISAVQEKDLETLWVSSQDEALSRKQRALLTIVLHRKLAIPLATIIFALVAVPLACSRTAGARARGFLYSSAIVGAYYYIGRAVELSARGGTFNPVLAAWLPNMLGVAGLAILLWRFRRSAV
jgi:lipopolysaccharide export LptBFGC system permease protein LptF